MVVERRFLQRLSTFTAQDVQLLHDGSAVAALAICERSAAQHKIQRHEAVTTLFALVSETTDAELRRRRVNLRRAIRGDHYQGFKACLDPASSAFRVVQKAEESYTRQLASVKAFRAVYDAEHDSGRMNLAVLASDVRFLAGIEISSAALLESVTRRGIGVQKNVQMDERLTRGVLRYFLRAAMKATPFGTFCMIQPSEWDGVSHTSDSRHRDRDEPWSTLTLNRSLHGEIVAAVLAQHTWRERLPVALNPSAMLTSEGWLTMASRGGMESVVRIRNTPIVDAVVGALREVGPVSESGLAGRVAERLGLELADSTAVQFAIDQLVDAGLLQRRIAIDEIDAHWPARLADALVELREPMMERVACDIRNLVEMTEGGSIDRASKGRNVSAPAREVVRRIGDTLGASLETTLATPVHEEYFASRHTAALSRDAWELPLRVLGQYVREMLPLSSPRIEQLGMRRFFDTAFSDRQSVPLYEYYERISAELLKDAPEPGALATGRTLFTDALLGDPFDLEGVKAVRAARELVAQRLADVCATASKIVHVQSRELFRKLGALPPTASGPISTSVFATPVVAAEGQRMLVVNQGSFGLGFGKYFSRFARFAPSPWRDGIVRRNCEIGVEEEVCELVGIADFGANVHECLSLRRVRYPTDAAPGSCTDITLRGLHVARHPRDEHRLVLLEHETGRLITLVDGGFLSIRLRPALHQLLACFVPVRGGMCRLPERTRFGSSALAHRPRIVVDGALVICRESWEIEYTHFPQRNKGEAASTFFCRARQFWKAEAMPTRCFVRLNQAPAQGILPQELDTESTERGRRDDPHVKMVAKEWNKPMYFDLDSPLLVAQLGAVCHGMTTGTVVIEEALPDLLGEHRGGNSAHATEWTLELDWRDGDLE